MRGAITFDFHNTLAFCDAWFALEVHQLPSAFLRWRGEQQGQTPPPDVLARADTAYARLRAAIKEHGDELPAEEGVGRVLAELGLPVDRDEVARGVAALMHAALDETRPLPGAIATVRAPR